MMHGLVQPLLDWYTQSLLTGGYPLIILLMAIESSVVPLPSELVIPPGRLSRLHPSRRFDPRRSGVGRDIRELDRSGRMYWASRLAGRPIVIRYGRFGFISPEKVAGAERWSARFGSFGIFASRLLPVIRHLIGIPSGIVRFPFARYSLYTVTGSLTWCAVLAAVSVAAGNNAKLMSGDLKTITVWVSGALVALAPCIIFWFTVSPGKKASRVRAGPPALRLDGVAARRI